MDEQLVIILNHLLNEYSNSDEARKQINLQLNTDGFIQIDAVGSWIKQFCIHRFRNEILQCAEPTIVHVANKQENRFNKYEINCAAAGCSIPVIPTDAEYFVSFAILIEQSKLHEIFDTIKLLFKEIAERFPAIKMSITGDENLLEEFEYIKMICESLNDVLKYSCSENFRDALLNIVNVKNKQEAIDVVSKTLTDSLKDLEE